MKPLSPLERLMAIGRLVAAGHPESYAVWCVRGGWNADHPAAQLRWQLATFYGVAA